MKLVRCCLHVSLPMFLFGAHPAFATEFETYDDLRARFDRSRDTEVRDAAFARFLEADTLQLDLLVQAVLARNPDAESARQSWRAALARYPQDASLDDPMGSYAIAPASLGDESFRFGQTVTLNQRVPFPGKLGLRGRRALASADAAGESYEEVRLRLALAGVALFARYYALERSLEINDEHSRLLRDLQRSAEIQYAVGRASLQDPLQATLEAGHVAHQRIVLESERDAVVAQLNGLLHQPPASPLPPPPASLAAPQLPGGPPGDLLARAMEQRPEVRRAWARIRGAESAHALAKREYLPDLSLVGTYNTLWGEPRHRVLVGVAINLPIAIGRRWGAVEEADARLAEARSDLGSITDRVAVEIEQARLRLEEALHVLNLFEDTLLPVSRDRVEAALSGFKTGRNSFLALVEAERSLRTVATDRQLAAAEALRRRAELDRVLGRMPGIAGAEEILR